MKPPFQPRRASARARLLATRSFAAIMLWPAALWAAAVEAEPIVDELKRIERQAARAGGARAQFTVTYVPTAPEARQIIDAANKLQSQNPGRHVLSPEDAGRRSYRCLWRANGARRRLDRTYAAGNTETFVVPPGAKTPLGAYVIEPYSCVCEYRGLPLSEWIRRAAHAEVARGTVNGRRQTQISLIAGAGGTPRIDSPDDEGTLIVLAFDDDHRLRSREIYLEGRNYLVERTPHMPRLHARHEFSDHRPYDDAAGGKIWFPSKATLRYYVGETSAGVPLEEYAIRVELTTLELGVDVADETFAPPHPPEGPRPDFERDPAY